MNCIMRYLGQTNVRVLCTSSHAYNIAKVMNKIMNKSSSKSKKSKYYESPLASTEFGKGGLEGKQTINLKRTNVLNKLFMRYITDLMASGECSSNFVGHGIEISRVKVSSDFTSVNIYWIARGTQHDKIIEDVLKTHVGVLRHELSQLKVVGVVPRLEFVKDKHYAVMAEVDRLLAIADFGEDHVPIDVSARLRTQLELNTALDLQTIHRIQSLENSETDDENFPIEYIPPMPQNMFNLNHSEMMERIAKSKLKKPVQETQSNIFDKPINTNAITFANENEERDAFRKFLHKRHILKDKATQVSKNYQPGLEYLQEEWFECQNNNEYLEGTMEERDFIDDDFDKK